MRIKIKYNIVMIFFFISVKPEVTVGAECFQRQP